MGIDFQTTLTGLIETKPVRTGLNHTTKDIREVSRTTEFVVSKMLHPL